MRHAPDSRYSRQIVLPEIGERGQEVLRRSSVLQVGAGGLGCASLPYLAAAGFGRFTIADADTVQRHNLARQALYGDADLGLHKAECAARRLRTINPDIRVDSLNAMVTADNAEQLIREHDVIIDGSDNTATRYVLNDACFMIGRPLVFGGIHGYEGRVSVFDAPDTPCYRCIYPVPPSNDLLPNCAETGVLGVLPGVIGLLQAAEALKLRLELGESARGVVLHFNLLDASLERMSIPRDPDCPLCGPRAVIDRVQDPFGSAAAEASDVVRIEAAELAAHRRRGPLQILDLREAHEYARGHLPGARLCSFSAAGVYRTLLEQAAGRVDKQVPTVIYCATETRSTPAFRTMTRSGWADVRVLRGGLAAWRNAGFELATDAADDALSGGGEPA